MSISAALSNALSGLTATARLADVSASNISNALTDGYGVREAVLAPRSGGDLGGVSVLRVRRLVDQVLISDRRQAQAELAYSAVDQSFFTNIQVQMGLPTDTGSLSDRLAQIEASLAEATRAPESEPNLLKVKDTLAGIANQLNKLGDSVQTERVRADKSIATEVGNLNNALTQIGDLNEKIRKHLLFDHDVSSMLDQRQTLIDYVSERIPVTELDRGYGTVALMAAGGTMLLDGVDAAKLEFTHSAVITADMSLSGGTLSALTVDGRTIATAKEPNEISGGRLDALFRQRDTTTVEVQAQLDGFARDLIERFEDPAVDPTRSTSDPGLLTDDGAVLDPLYEVGLSQRIKINPLVDPSQGGAAWRIRDGLGASAPGPEGQTAGLMRLSGALTAYSAPSSSAFSGGLRTSATLAADLVSHVGGALERAESSMAFSQAQYDTMKNIELEQGVDTDAEMQRLLVIEQNYAANAQVVQTVSDMIDWLMRI